MAKDTTGPGHNGPSITLTELCSAISEHAELKEDIGSATGRLRSAIKQFVGEHDLHKGAYGDIRKIADMTTTGRADYLRTFHPLFLMMFDDAWKGELNDLLAKLDEEANAENADDPDDGDAE